MGSFIALPQARPSGGAKPPRRAALALALRRRSRGCRDVLWPSRPVSWPLAGLDRRADSGGRAFAIVRLAAAPPAQRAGPARIVLLAAASPPLWFPARP